jgi:hypothetical protein
MIRRQCNCSTLQLYAIEVRMCCCKEYPVVVIVLSCFGVSNPLSGNAVLQDLVEIANLKIIRQSLCILQNTN